MPLALADTVNVSAALGLLSDDWWGWRRGGFPLEPPLLPFGATTTSPATPPSSAAPATWVLAWKDLGSVRKGVMVERWLARLISSWGRSEGGRRGPGQVWGPGRAPGRAR